MIVMSNIRLVWEKWDKGEPVDHWYDDEWKHCVLNMTNGEWFHYKMCPGDVRTRPIFRMVVKTM